ncbi:MAG: hypothetical protein MUC80_09770 [Candidatus Thermoplasmatota archaeon]|nr:hypothetical protein [Candidatus Thermoplasmatota archaeon]
MVWHCKSCNRNFVTDPKIRETTGKKHEKQTIEFCPYCNSDKIEKMTMVNK